MKWIRLFILLTLGIAARTGFTEPVTQTLHPERTEHGIDEKVYSHFLEHIYHSVHGGLWGDLVWNRSFEQHQGGDWSREGDVVTQRAMGTNQRLVFGNSDWGDFEYTLEARKTGGEEGFLVLFRVQDEQTFYWCNLGGWGNQRHQLERGRAGGERWHGVGPAVDGSIDRDRWYRIVVRCEGARIQVWLDDERLVDFTDPEGHLHGAVGVGTWSTRAQYRKLQVRSLDGSTLFSGMPELLTRPMAAQHWRAYGNGTVLLQRGDALNSDAYQRVESGDEETGLEQLPVQVVPGEQYTGSLWLRGTSPDGVVVRLRDDTGVLAEQTLPAVNTSDWQETTFTLPVTRASSDGVLQIGIPARGRIDLDQVSMIPESWRREGGCRPDLLKAVADLKPPVIRWPGGCFASPYRWKDGIGPQHQRGMYPREIWDDQDVNNYGTDEFIRMCRKIGAEPLIVVNIGSRQWNPGLADHDFLQEALDWMEYCNGPADSTWGRVRAQNGHPEPYGVKFWEIDNETWHMGAEGYAKAVQRFAPAMRAADPSIQLAACGSGGLGDGGNGMAWNRVLIETCADLVDYLSIHHYENPDRFAEGPAVYEDFFRRTGQLIAGSANPDLKIYVSEWNAQSTDWRTGLYAGGLLNAFERCGDLVTLGGPALFLRHSSATAWDNAFINFDHTGSYTAPNYVVMKWWREHYAPTRITLTGEAGGLNTVATRDDSGRLVWKAVNPTGVAVPVILRLAGGVAVQQASMEQVAPGSLSARNTLAQPDAVRVTRSTILVSDGQANCTLPPWSAVVVVLH